MLAAVALIPLLTSDGAAEEVDVAGFIASLRPSAEAHDISPAFFDRVFAGVTADPTLAALTARQPEFAKPLGAYLAAQVTPSRVKQGQALMRRWNDALTVIERHSGVPRAIIVAIWGLETNYGVSVGDKDVIRSMATLAASGVRPDLYRGELIAALTMLQSGEVTRAQLRGSWAGAMGQPQFMPSSFLRDAVDGDGDGRRDIWGNVPDALASIANFLKSNGWQPGRSWGAEVTVPAKTDLAISRGSVAEWVARGIVPKGKAMSADAGETVLFFPTGEAGPAFLVTANFEVIKTYNFSDAYVLSVADLAGQIAGEPSLTGPWPRDPPMARDARIALQGRLVALGYPVDRRDGRISLALRDTIRLAQRSVGIVADGNPTDVLLHALEGTRQRADVRQQ